MSHPSRKFWTVSLTILAIVGLLTGMFLPFSNLNKAQAATQKAGTTPPYIKGPFTSQPVYPAVFNGDLRDLPQLPSEGGEVPAPRTIKQPNQGNLANSTSWVDPVAQQSFAQGQMPDPTMSFDGLNITDGGGWHPPDTNGDVGPYHYIQTVNIAIGIYSKANGEELVNISFNEFFDGTGTPCDDQNRGDVISLYDPQVDRWIVMDFSLPSGGPYFECIAVSQTGDPVVGGWYFYALQTNTEDFADFWNDYPKLGVWADGWYMSANMFDSTFGGVRVWALDRTAMMAGDPLNEVHFDCHYDPIDAPYCTSFLPANIRGDLPPYGSPEYFANVLTPNILNIWEFHTDWAVPDNSTFTGPFPVSVADFQYAGTIPQKNTSQELDSLGDRLMMQLQYRNVNGIEALYVNHSVVSGGVVGIRWYEVRDPGGTPVLFQQGTYQPDQNYRWMGAIAADQDGNIAIGYSVSSSDMFPAIRYAGRLAGETPNLLTQNEAVLIQGTGSQTGSNRWGDYSAMTVDPYDGCTFWYTQEYLKVTSGNWETRIGSFKFPSCGQLKGSIEGYVHDSMTNLPLVGAPVSAVGNGYNFSVITDDTGFYTMNLAVGTYDVTAGPFLPGYPDAVVAVGLPVTTGDITSQDFLLTPKPSLADAGISLIDNVPFGNGNGYAEPGEQGLELSEYLLNQGAITSTMVTAKLTSLTEGVAINTVDTNYPDIPVGVTETNTMPYVFSVVPTFTCGTDMSFQALITDSITNHTTNFSLTAGVPITPEVFYSNDVEGGAADWTTGGTTPSWGITTQYAHSPTHSWTDSPNGNYLDNANNWVRTQTLDLTGKKHVQLSGWYKYALEEGYDYAYIEYSLDGGTTWNPPLATFNGFHNWQELIIDASMLDNQSNVTLRFRLKSDGGVVYDGLYVDDVKLIYVPYECTYSPLPDSPTLISPANGSWVSSPVTFVWQSAESGAPTEGYVFYLDDTPVVTFTTLITTTTLDVSPWAHTWYVKATNKFGESLPSSPWSFDVFGKFFLPLIQK